jgi:preprotein translocase subunit SecD
VYLDIEFNKEGTKKLEEISKKYVEVEESEDTEDTEDTEAVDETEEVEEETDTDEETTTEKTITMKIDDEEIMSTSFDETIENGKLQLSIGSSTTDTDTLKGYADQATSMATVLDTGNIPVKYDLDENQYILSDITANEMQIAMYIVLGIIAVALVVLVIRYKSLGILGTISYIGLVSLLMIVIRYTNVVLSIEGLFGMVVIFALNYILVSKLLAKANNRAEVYKEFFIKIIPIIILAITFCFISWTPISSFGMVIFWGIVLIAFYNGIVTNNLLKINARKEK